MDTIKIGKFLTELRHQHGYSQEQLGEKLGVTNKTVSRWETGKYLPPIDILQLMSDLYGVTINEIVNGKYVSDEEYKDLAEETIKSVLSQSSFTLQDRISYFKKKWIKEHWISFTFKCICLVIISVILIRMNQLFIGIVPITLLGLYMYENNRMMAYVENNAFESKSGN